jgi:thiosulfate/3-mercaptopyruvate sulfurtransferase
MMARKILYSANELQQALQASRCIVVDCRFNLVNTGAGYAAYLESHIPGAAYAHLDDDLSSPVTAASGRHPLPETAAFAAFLARIGWRPGTVVVAYDDAGGSIAARLWWLMKYFGHDCGALLDGGLAAWREAGFALEDGVAEPEEAPAVDLAPDHGMVLSAREVTGGLQTGGIVLADARTAERFRGEVEPIDPVAGHIPGACNFPNARVLEKDGRFRAVGEIHQDMAGLLGARPAGDLVHMCGSGVTACLNLFAAELAGLQGGRLYAGSWSEWIREPSRPIA